MLCAHAMHLIDLTKDIHPIAEGLLFNYIEAKWDLDIAKIYPIYDNEHIYYITKEWLNHTESCILYKEKETTNNKFTDKINLLKKLNNMQ